ncbi:MAG: SCP-like extracellular [Actinobacteria bacterium]|nr:SCP-like extracellular [Actinomycetota bacterium]
MKLVVNFATFRRIWPAPAVALALALVAGSSAVPASADTLIPLPLPGISLSPNASVPPAPSVDALETTMLAKLNAERAAGGLGALALQPWASSVARAHSNEMAAGRDIWHNHTGYLDIAQQAIGAYLTGENVAEAGTLDETDSLLMNSPPHRANILYPAFNYVGIGVALDAVGYVYVTQDFVTIRPAPVVRVAAMASPAAPVATVPRVAAAAVPATKVPAPPRSVPKPATGMTAAGPVLIRRLEGRLGVPVPHLSPLVASPVAATRLVLTRRVTGPAVLPVVVWVIVLAALAGVVHARVTCGRQTPNRGGR